MFVRATTIHADLDRLQDGIDYIRREVVPAARALPGNLGLSMNVDRDTGLAMVATAWETEADRDASMTALGEQREKATMLLGATTFVTELLELAVLDRLRPAQAGFWTRLTRVAIAPELVDQAIDAFASSTLHDLQLLDGYCSAVLLVDRARGLGGVQVTFDSRQALETSRFRAEQLRDIGTAKSGAGVVEVREAEVVIAGISLPQTG
jgi:hypothetical protein